jgi:steroid delta-isomerase-like uncharacterized protein
MTTTEQNKAIVREFIDGLFTKGDLGAVDTYLAEDFVNRDPPFGAASDREGMHGAGAMFRAAFADWHSDIDHLIGEGDLVVERFTASGTQQGEIMGVPATGRTVTLRGIQIFRIRDGRIVERWGKHRLQAGDLSWGELALGPARPLGSQRRPAARGQRPPLAAGATKNDTEIVRRD